MRGTRLCKESNDGWTKLVLDNRLQVVDAIVLELMEQYPKVILKVHVFRD